MKRRNRLIGAAAPLAGLAGWWLDRTGFFAAWLAAWLFCMGIVMGGLANVWIHTLTGGRWGEGLRAPLLAAGRLTPWLALLFLPILLGLADLYPWATGAEQGARWAGELSAPDFKSAWLQPAFFAARAVAVLLLWCGLAWASRQPALSRSRPFAAAALILWGLSLGLVAATDWVMSLMPLWYSSSFGLLVGVGQVLAGMAFAVALAARAAAPDRAVLRDLGNLLLCYVLTWAYLAFTQFLIIWSENLPREIDWYVARRGAWLALGIGLIVAHFALPLLILLFRGAKQSPALLGGLAVGLLAAHLLDLWWLILPSLSVTEDSIHLWWMAPLLAAGLAAALSGVAGDDRRAPAERLQNG